MPLSFGNPWALLLILLLPGIYLLAKYSRSGLEPVRSWVSISIRALIFLMLVFAIADAHWVTRNRQAATVFVLDYSASIPQEMHARAIEYIQKKVKEMPQGDQTAVVVFGNESMIEVPLGPELAMSGVRSAISRGNTDLAAAIRLATAIFPEGFQRRIVLLTDGNENKGHAMLEVENARAHGVTIDVRTLAYDYPNEVWIDGLHVPNELNPREPFEVRVVVNSQKEGNAKLQLRRNDQLVLSETVPLVPGKNVFPILQKVDSPGSYTYEALIDAPDDGLYQNNKAFAHTSSRGGAKVLVVSGGPTEITPLAETLRLEGIDIELIEADEVLRRAPTLTSYDGIVFVNVGAGQMPSGAFDAIESAVHDAGVGFLMIGGENSFGPGGYRGSPIEKVLPVTMEQPQRRVIPNGALALVLHTCEIPDGNHWAKEISIAALNVLGPQDYFGIVIYGNQGEQWLFNMTPVTDKAKMIRAIRGSQSGDMPSFDLSMQLAHQGLKAVNASAKHMVIISDADPSGPTQALINSIVGDKITISCVAIHPHGPSDVNKMKAVAGLGKGNFYFPQNPNELPQIFIKEATTIRRSMIIEETSTPQVRLGTEILKGIAPGSLPPLHGYTLINPKPTAEVPMLIGKEGDALLATWIYGLGRSTAWTSDAKPRWAKDWVAWDNYRKFWANAVRSVLRTIPKGPYQMQSEIFGGRGRVMIDALDENGKFVATLKFQGAVTGPDGKKQSLNFRQTGPGRYEAEFVPGEVGIYSVNATYVAGNDRGLMTQGVAMPYMAEYRDLKPNQALLERIAAATSGRLLAWGDKVFVPMSRPAESPHPLWPLLFLLSLIAFPVDVFIRRVVFDPRSIFAWMASKIRREKQVEAEPAAPAPLQKLLRKKEEVRLEAKHSIDLESPPGQKPVAPIQAAPPAKPKPEAPPPPPPKKQEDGADHLKRLLDIKRKQKDKKG
jgi:uncharacterized membrane protein